MSKEKMDAAREYCNKLEAKLKIAELALREINAVSSGPGTNLYIADVSAQALKSIDEVKDESEKPSKVHSEAMAAMWEGKFLIAKKSLKYETDRANKLMQENFKLTDSLEEFKRDVGWTPIKDLLDNLPEHLPDNIVFWSKWGREVDIWYDSDREVWREANEDNYVTDAPTHYMILVGPK